MDMQVGDLSVEYTYPQGLVLRQNGSVVSLSREQADFLVKFYSPVLEAREDLD